MTSMKWQPPRPSVFTPFLRRFTDERAQDIGDTRKLYARVTERHRATIWAEAGTPYNLAGVIMNDAGIPIPRLIMTEVRNCLAAILSLEKPMFSTPEIGDDIGNLSLKELVDLRRFLRSQEHFLDHEDRTLRTLCEPLTNIVMGVLAELPKLDAPSPFTIPLINLLPDPYDIVEKICGTLTEDAIFDCGLFTELNERPTAICANCMACSSMPKSGRCSNISLSLASHRRKH